ncbi:MAG: hypothetical protein KAR35_05135 [Candidatus Heimdallarchaeota archaeon]|nr:hypothetical protein [Candidatus Heimdallarchaeota archaeon]MCK5048741.1 hypothetical protein [Candidatus Heimdallarchaeota archaeon]
MSDLLAVLYSVWFAEIFLLLVLGALTYNHLATKDYYFLIFPLVSFASLLAVQLLIFLELADDTFNFFCLVLLSYMPLHLLLHPRVERTNIFLDRSTEIAFANFILILTLIADQIIYVIFAVWGLILIRKELKPFFEKRPFSLYNLKMSSWVVIYIIGVEIPLYYQAIDLEILYSLFAGFNALFILGLFKTYQYKKAQPIVEIKKVELKDLEQTLKDEATKSVESRLVGLFDKPKDKPKK